MSEFENQIRPINPPVPTIVFEDEGEVYENIDLHEDKYYERTYHCLNCANRSDACIKDGIPCPKNVECPVCKCKFMNPVDLFAEE